jgi:hypothetical protein
MPYQVFFIERSVGSVLMSPRWYALYDRSNQNNEIVELD